MFSGASAAPEPGPADAAPEENNEEDDEDAAYIVLRQPHGRDVAFLGEKIGSASLVGTVGDSVKTLVKETNLYRTKAGRFVIEEISGSALGSQIMACENQDEVIAHLGSDWMAKELYRQSGIEDVEIIE